MLIIRRRIGERIVVGSNIEITVASATKKVVRLAISAPKGITVLRGEIHDAVVAANLAATTGGLELHLEIDVGDDEDGLGEGAAETVTASEG
ncbi:MAG: carbon storage regulator [Myxococcales bacterium]|nr:carbon storage regulator [Myxococcales bacterium]